MFGEEEGMDPSNEKLKEVVKVKLKGVEEV